MRLLDKLEVTVEGVPTVFEGGVELLVQYRYQLSVLLLPVASGEERPSEVLNDVDLLKHRWTILRLVC